MNHSLKSIVVALIEFSALWNKPKTIRGCVVWIASRSRGAKMLGKATIGDSWRWAIEHKANSVGNRAR